MEKTIVCDDCGERVIPTVEGKCPNCGSQLQIFDLGSVDKKVSSSTCKNCGRTLIIKNGKCSVCGKPFDSANINERIQHSMETRENSFAKKDIVKSSGVLAAFALVFYYLQLAGMIIGGLVQLFYFFMFLFNGKGLFAFLSFLGLAFIIATGLVFMYMWSHVRAFFLGINTLYYNEIKDHQ